MTQYTLRDIQFLQRELNRLKERQQSLQDYMTIELLDIEADRRAIQLELELLNTIGRYDK